MRFFSLNDVNDEGFELTDDEVVAQFLASEDYIAWAKHGGGRLSRYVLHFLSSEVGGWDPEDDEYVDRIVDLVLARRP